VPAILQLEGPSRLGCVGCTRPTSQPGTQGVQLAGALRGKGLQGAVGGILAASPFMMLMGFGFGAFLAWRYALAPKASSQVSGHRRRRR
jgi:hypothetical protein